MSRWIASLAALVFLAADAPDYIVDRKAAMSLMQSGKTEEALAAFQKLIDIAMTDLQKSDARQQAALCANSLKQYDQALELAKQIPMAPMSKFTQMQILSSARKWQELVDTFGGEDIGKWPDSLKGEAYFVRGDAHYTAKNGAAAESDLKQAADYLLNANSLGLCLNHLGDTYRDLLKDEPQAIEAYRRTYRAGTIYKQCQAAISVAGILEGHQKYTEAVDELNRIDMDQVEAPFWRGAMLRAFGHALAGAGRKDEAVAKYKAALEVKDLPEGIRKQYEKELKALQ